MTEEEQIEYIKAKTEGENYNKRVFENYRGNMANRHNPRFVEALKGTPFESNPDMAFPVLAKKHNDNFKLRYNNYIEAWKNLFESPNVFPFKKISPRDLMGKYLSESQGQKGSEKLIHAIQWLKSELINERRNLSIKEKGNV